MILQRAQADDELSLVRFDGAWHVAGVKTDRAELILGALFGCGVMAWPSREMAKA